MKDLEQNFIFFFSQNLADLSTFFVSLQDNFNHFYPNMRHLIAKSHLVIYIFFCL